MGCAMVDSTLLIWTRIKQDTVTDRMEGLTFGLANNYSSSIDTMTVLWKILELRRRQMRLAYGKAVLLGMEGYKEKDECFDGGSSEERKGIRGG